ncbi:hypothetical protein [Prosthecomicrobium sp. N25]|uniref:hypothetical protein n=1 Tax=Prosthecomicrobium sp. N25 TaxID=3129254 RepID=UPI0030774292
MIELIVTACLAANPAECRDIRLGSVEGIVDQIQCRKMGQIESARWIGEHPGYVIKMWRCGPPKQDV